MSTPSLVSRTIWVTFAFPGIHCYPDAPDDVAYLRVPHRHLFKFRVEISVSHNEREIEFHQFLNWLKGLYTSGTLELDSQSCETIAERLAHVIQARYPDRIISVEVSEDGECGSIVKLGPSWSEDGEFVSITNTEKP